MANIARLKSGKWRVQIRSHNKYISKTFFKESSSEYGQLQKQKPIVVGKLSKLYKDI